MVASVNRMDYDGMQTERGSRAEPVAFAQMDALNA
jgi:hypothetical protein